MNRDAIIAQLERLGAHVGSAVSSKTDLLLVGQNPGSNKTSKARDLQTPMMSLAFFSYLELDVDRAGPRGLESISDDFITSLQLYLAIYTEELYGQYRQARGSGDSAGENRYWWAFVFARRALQRLLRLAWGSVAEEHVSDGPAVARGDLELVDE